MEHACVFNIYIFNLLHLYNYVYACNVCIRVAHVELKGKFVKLGSLLPPYRHWGSNSGHQTWR